jgi:hypothetical protein
MSGTLKALNSGLAKNPDLLLTSKWNTREDKTIIRWWRAVAGTDEVLEQYADHLRRTTFVEMA